MIEPSYVDVILVDGEDEESGYLPGVPRVGDEVRFRGPLRRVSRVIWEPKSLGATKWRVVVELEEP